MSNSGSMENTEEAKGEESVFQIFKTANKFQPKPKRASASKTPKRKELHSESDNEENSAKINRPRTPSGQVLTTSIGEIKTLLFTKEFQSQPKKKSKQFEFNPFKAICEHVESVTHNQPTITHLNHTHTIAINPSKQTLSGNMAGDQKDEESVEQSENVQMQHQTTSMEESDVTKNSQIVEKYLRQAMSAPTNTDVPPATMDVRTVIQMLGELRIELKSDIVREISDLKQAILGDGESPLPSLREHQVQQATVKARLDVCEARERMMIDTMAGMADSIRALQERAEQAESTNAKRMLIISGLEVIENNKKHAREQLEHFFADKFDMQIMIEEFLPRRKCTTTRYRIDSIIVSSEESCLPTT